MREAATGPKPTVINITGPEGVRIEQTSTRGDGSIELGESFALDSIDFTAASDHISVHTDGEIAGSQFDGEQFSSPEDIIGTVTDSLPETLRYDQHGMAELTVEMEDTRVGFTGVKSLAELEAMDDVVIERGIRTPGGEPGEVDGKQGAWYPEVVRNPETGSFEVATNPDGTVKNPHGKFEPEAFIAKTSEDSAPTTFATNKVTVIIKKNPETGSPTVLTMYPGEVAPAYPARIQSEAFQLDTLQGGQEAAYWQNHAFIELGDQIEEPQDTQTA